MSSSHGPSPEGPFSPSRHGEACELKNDLPLGGYQVAIVTRSLKMEATAPTQEAISATPSDYGAARGGGLRKQADHKRGRDSDPGGHRIPTVSEWVGGSKQATCCPGVPEEKPLDNPRAISDETQEIGDAELERKGGASEIKPQGRTGKHDGRPHADAAGAA